MINKKQDKEINSLILSIQSAMNDYTEGNISFEEAKEEYKNLLGIYNKLEADNKKEEGPNIISGLCYYNNIENFSLLSGIYHLSSKKTTQIAYYGSESLNSKTMNTILDNINNIKGNRMIMIQPDGSHMLHPIYVYPLFTEKNDKIVFATVSSSTYFSKEKFSAEGKLFKELFSITRPESHYLEVNYFDKISNKIDKYLQVNVDDEYYIQATLFVFNIIEKIFNHLGIHSLIDISNLIMDNLKSNFKENSECFALSVRDYLVLQKLRKDCKSDEKKTNIEFRYNDINIPYKTLNLDLETGDSIHNFWNKILLFEYYLEADDINI